LLGSAVVSSIYFFFFFLAISVLSLVIFLNTILYWTSICCSPRSHRFDFHPFSLNSSWPNLTCHYI